MRSALAVAAFAFSYLMFSSASSAQKGDVVASSEHSADEGSDWSINTTSKSSGAIKSVDALATGVFGSGNDFDLIIIRMQCNEGNVRLLMDRVFADKSRIFDATFYKDYETANIRNIRTYWRSDDGEREATFDGSPEQLFASIGDGNFDVMVESKGGKLRLYSFDAYETKLTLARVKAACTSK